VSGKAELGLGIHGEPGVLQIDYHNAEQAMAEVCAKLAEVMDNEPHVALLNNLGGASALEMSILANDLIKSPIGENLEVHCWASGADDIPRYARFLRVGSIHSVQRTATGCRRLARRRLGPGCRSVSPVQVIDLPQGLRADRAKPLRTYEETAMFLAKMLSHHDRGRSRLERARCEVRRRRHRLNPCRSRARSDRRTGPVAIGRPYRTVPRHRTRIQPDHGWVFWCSFGDLFHRSRRRRRKWAGESSHHSNKGWSGCRKLVALKLAIGQ
jgi:hypothetical protein